MINKRAAPSMLRILLEMARARPDGSSATLWLRLSLGLVYLWFGALKLAGSTPVLGMIRDLCPRLAAAPLYCALIAWEIGLGALFLSGRWIKPAALGAMLHLIGTFGVAVFDPTAVFFPHFPFLTLQGEFLAKNFVLLAAAYALWSGCHYPASVSASVASGPAAAAGFSRGG